jgi:predicted nuclease with TOPRIM domain
MTAREQLRHVCGRNRELARENTRLKEELRRLEQECQELGDANVNLRVEVETADVIAGSAMAELLERRER